MSDNNKRVIILAGGNGLIGSAIKKELSDMQQWVICGDKNIPAGGSIDGNVYNLHVDFNVEHEVEKFFRSVERITEPAAKRNTLHLVNLFAYDDKVRSDGKSEKSTLWNIDL